MRKQDLLLVLENPSLSKVLLNVLSEGDKSNDYANTSLESFLLENNSNPNLVGRNVPKSVDLRDRGHRAASQFVSEHDFQIGQRFDVWYSGHESSLRQALERKGLRPSITTLMKGKKYRVQIEKKISPRAYARKKSP